MGSLTPPSLLPACNGALTHNSSGGADSSVLWRDASGNVGMWPMNGSSISQSKVVPSNVPTNWSIVGKRDFNYDGNADIPWRDNSGNVASG
jgi:serralysin